MANVFPAADRLNTSRDDIAESYEHDLYELLFPGRGERQSVYAQPDWLVVHKELARAGVTLKLLHSKDADEHADGGQPVMGYHRFCRVYQHYVMQSGVASRAGHKSVQIVEGD